MFLETELAAGGYKAMPIGRYLGKCSHSRKGIKIFGLQAITLRGLAKSRRIAVGLKPGKPVRKG
jgi:hypothetical protein